MRHLLRRLERLEARVAPSAPALSILVQFVDPQMRVTSTLHLGPGQERVWTYFPTDENTQATSIRVDV
jgi:hypothetical protein